MGEIARLKSRLNKEVMERVRGLKFTSYENLLSTMAMANSVDWRVLGYEYSLNDLVGQSSEDVIVIGGSLAAISSMVERSRLIYVGLDNAGEAVVDLLASAWLAERGHKVVVVARSEPYEVDVTHYEALEIAKAMGIDGVNGLEILGTGSMYPPLYRSVLPRELRTLLDRADLVIGKGIANLEASLESLDEFHAAKTINLFRAKCSPLSRIAGTRGAPVVALASEFLKIAVKG